MSTGHTRLKLWFKSSSSGSSSKTSSSSVDNNPAGGGGAGGGENVIVTTTPHPSSSSQQQIYGITSASSSSNPNGVRRLSTASGSGVSVGTNPHYGNNGVYGYNPNYAPVGVAPEASYSPTATTEVSISSKLRTYFNLYLDMKMIWVSQSLRRVFTIA